MNNFYVYRHIRLDTNNPFYVGKGSNNRAFSKWDRNNYWKNITEKYGYNVEIIIENLTEKEAFEKEIEFIELYKSQGYCEANFTEGGEGLSGYKFSKKVLIGRGKKISKKLKGHPVSKNTKTKIRDKLKGGMAWNRGKKSTKNHKLNLSISHGGKKFNVFKAIRVQNACFGQKAICKKGEFIGSWINQAECSNFLKLSQSGIWQCLNKILSQYKNYMFEYVDEKRRSNVQL